MIGCCVKLNSEVDVGAIRSYVNALYPQDTIAANYYFGEFPIYFNFEPDGWYYGFEKHYLNNSTDYGHLIPIEAVLNPSAYPEHFI